ncbi:MAG: hypothetical protein IPK16_01730 [Anaerolineales bacterium]|nr:hypothetical protein [Anaerolineales bacterium]
MFARPASGSWRYYLRVLVLTYALYAGLILPFVCWGAWAVPGHPHGHPHFVFSPPDLTPSHHAAHVHDNESQPVAQALPEMVLAVHAPLLMLAATSLTFRPRHERRVLRIACGERQFSPFVPTPPPRLGCAS